MLHNRLDIEYDLRKNYKPVARPRVDSHQNGINRTALFTPLRKALQNLLNAADNYVSGPGVGAGRMQVNY